jgi:hypothetical protein
MCNDCFDLKKLFLRRLYITVQCDCKCDTQIFNPEGFNVCTECSHPLFPQASGV